MIIEIINGDTILQYSRPTIGGVAHGHDSKYKQDWKLLSSDFIALQSEGQPVDSGI